MTLEELDGRMGAAELIEWQAYYHLEPFGEERGDVRIAMLCQLVANALRAKGRPAYKLAEFMPKFGGRGRGLTPARVREMMATMNAFTAKHNADQAKAMGG